MEGAIDIVGRLSMLLKCGGADFLGILNNGKKNWRIEKNFFTLRKLMGGASLWIAEIIPFEPDPDNAGVVNH